MFAYGAGEIFIDVKLDNMMLNVNIHEAKTHLSRLIDLYDTRSKVITL